jgi:hypothetical protein
MQARFSMGLARFVRVKEEKKETTDGQDRASNLNPTDGTSIGENLMKSRRFLLGKKGDG